MVCEKCWGAEFPGCPNCEKDSDSSEKTSSMRGLKDHEIQELVNAIRDAISPMIPYQCLRDVIARATTTYLSDKGLQIDKK